MSDKYSNLRARLAALKLSGPVSTSAAKWNAASDALDVELVAELLAERDAMSAALSEAKAGGWQPIETAPKDGTEILLLFSKSEYILGKPHGRVRAACWTGSGSSSNWSIPYFKDDLPTHWQPLPTPPKEQA